MSLQTEPQVCMTNSHMSQNCSFNPPLADETEINVAAYWTSLYKWVLIVTQRYISYQWTSCCALWVHRARRADYIIIWQYLSICDILILCHHIHSSALSGSRIVLVLPMDGVLTICSRSVVA